MKLIKFDLPINGTKVKNLEELRDNLTDEILALARSSQLERWLRTRQLLTQADAVVKAVKQEGTHKGLFLALCGVLEVEVHLDDVRAIFDAVPAPGIAIHNARYFEMYEALKNRIKEEKEINRKTKSAVVHHAGRECLLNLLRSLQVNFEIPIAQAKIHENYFHIIYEEFAHRFFDHLAFVRKNIPKNTQISQKVLDVIDELEETQIVLNRKVARRENGIEFREDFGKSLLVFITGKVKSGKSSLGNYIVWGHTDPDEALKQQVVPHLVPSYFSHENNAVDGGGANNEAQRQREFCVGATEATSSIQGFKLPGLTWVDSPGMHSINKLHEELARDYVEHADLILYTMKSDAPGRASDLAEIQQLLGKDKKVLLLLTGSDDVEEDFDDETDSLVQTVVMKDAKRREKQHAYVREALRELANGSGDSRIINLEIVSISARYAQLNADDPAAFSESGMELLFEKLHWIAQSDGIRIKQRAPIDRVSGLLQRCRHDLKYCRELLSSFGRQSKEEHESHRFLLVHDVEQLFEELMREISDFEHQLKRMFEITRNA